MSGDRAAAQGGERTGHPAFAGMAVGHGVVRQFLERTGTGIVEAIFLPADGTTVRGSGYFDRAWAFPLRPGDRSSAATA